MYEFDGMTFYAPVWHISQFYDFLYLNALPRTGEQRGERTTFGGEIYLFYRSGN